MSVPNVVVIPFRDHWSMTEDLLGSLLADDVDAIVLLDNGSSVATRARADAYIAGRTTIAVLDAAGAGIHQMWNVGIRAASAATGGAAMNVAILNNDLAVEPGFLAGLARALRSDDRIQAVCPNYDGRPVVDRPVRLGGICEGRYDGTGGLSGVAFMIRSEWFASGWTFPDDARWWYGDALLTLTLDLAGAWYVMATDVAVVHLDGGSQTGRWQDPEVIVQLEADRAAFVRHARDDLGVVVDPPPVGVDPVDPG
jgi:GT2 family glycosyltransferase